MPPLHWSFPCESSSARSSHCGSRTVENLGAVSGANWLGERKPAVTHVLTCARHCATLPHAKSKYPLVLSPLVLSYAREKSLSCHAPDRSNAILSCELATLSGASQLRLRRIMQRTQLRRATVASEGEHPSAARLCEFVKQRDRRTGTLDVSRSKAATCMRESHPSKRPAHESARTSLLFCAPQAQSLVDSNAVHDPLRSVKSISNKDVTRARPLLSPTHGNSSVFVRLINLL